MSRKLFKTFKFKNAKKVSKIIKIDNKNEIIEVIFKKKTIKIILKMKIAKKSFIEIKKNNVLSIDFIKKKREIINVIKKLSVEMLKFNINYYTLYDLIKLNVNTHVEHFYIKSENYNIYIIFIIFDKINIKYFFTREMRLNNMHIIFIINFKLFNKKQFNEN